jgi:hypothetical protein
MLSSLPSKIVGGIFMSFLMTGSHAQQLDTPWRLRVFDVNNQVKVDATVRFTSESARSCMSGTWKGVVVEKTAARDDAFFPLNDPVAYELRDGVLTLGRTTICDGYLFLTGASGSEKIHGTYDAVGLGPSTNLGYFSLEKAQ